MRSKSSSFSGGEAPGVTNNATILESYKLVFIGDSKVGKTTLLNSYRKGSFHDNEKEPTPVLEGFTKTVVVDGREHLCLLWDTIGSTDFERLRPLSYPKTDCFVICFALNDRTSFDNLKTIWIPEISQTAPNIPYIFVGAKHDNNSNDNTDVKEEANEEPVKPEPSPLEAAEVEASATLVKIAEEGIAEKEKVVKDNNNALTAEEIQAYVDSTEGFTYLESSASDLNTVEEVLKASVKAVAAHQLKMKELNQAKANSQSFCRIL